MRMHGRCNEKVACFQAFRTKLSHTSYNQPNSPYCLLYNPGEFGIVSIITTLIDYIFLFSLITCLLDIVLIV